MSIFGRHRVRATFYHMGAIVFLLTTALYIFDMISTEASYVITSVLFVVDYLAEMYDPHPETPGPWFSKHFHRFFEDDEPSTGNDYSFTFVDGVLSFNKNKTVLFTLRW